MSSLQCHQQVNRNRFRSAHTGLPDGVGVGGAGVHGYHHGAGILLRGLLGHRQPDHHQMDRTKRLPVGVEPRLLHLGGHCTTAPGRFQSLGFSRRAMVGTGYTEDAARKTSEACHNSNGLK
jgi:hypothetical protein